MNIKRIDLIGGIFFLSAGILFALYSRSLDVGNGKEPGAGFLPFWGGLILTGMAALFLIKTVLVQASETEPFFPEKDSWKRIALTVLSLFLYIFLFTPLGFTLTTFLFVGFLVKCIFLQGWKPSIVSAALSARGARLLFINLLGIQFPRGFLGW